MLQSKVCCNIHKDKANGTNAPNVSRVAHLSIQTDNHMIGWDLSLNLRVLLVAIVLRDRMLCPVLESQRHRKRPSLFVHPAGR